MAAGKAVRNTTVMMGPKRTMFFAIFDWAAALGPVDRVMRLRRPWKYCKTAAMPTTTILRSFKFIKPRKEFEIASGVLINEYKLLKISGEEKSLKKIRYKAMRIGNWISKSKKPEKGLTLLRFQTAIKSSACFSLLFLCCSWIAFISGWRRCITICDLKLL